MKPFVDFLIGEYREILRTDVRRKFEMEIDDVRSAIVGLEK